MNSSENGVARYQSCYSCNKFIVENLKIKLKFTILTD